MGQRKWLTPSKLPGTPNLVPVTWKISRPLHLALREFALTESKTAGRKISQATILTTLALEASPQLRLLVAKQKETDQ